MMLIVYAPLACYGFMLRQRLYVPHIFRRFEVSFDMLLYFHFFFSSSPLSFIFIFFSS